MPRNTCLSYFGPSEFALSKVPIPSRRVSSRLIIMSFTHRKHLPYLVIVHSSTKSFLYFGSRRMQGRSRPSTLSWQSRLARGDPTAASSIRRKLTGVPRADILRTIALANVSRPTVLCRPLVSLRFYQCPFDFPSYVPARSRRDMRLAS